MRKWTIGKQITAGFASVILITLALGAFASTRLMTIRGHSDRVARFSLPTLELVFRAQRNVAEFEEAVYKHIGRTDADDMTRLESDLATLTADNTKIYEELGRLVTEPRGVQLLGETQLARTAYVQIRGRVLADSRLATNSVSTYETARNQLDPASDKYLSALGALVEYLRTDADQSSGSIQNAVGISQTGILLGLCAAVVIGAGIAFVIIRKTSGILHRIANALDEGANQVAAASSQVSASSQSLAEGASEQAASLEETSASLEEISSMTKKNADNAQTTKGLANKARVTADAGAGEMELMSQAMQEIKTSSDDIAKIIKTIDEIAFQTNILALNAAVEAARAGEAGMGFAVVADEVRNLAQRSAQAAKETSAQIEAAIGKTAQGVQRSGKVAQSLAEIVTNIRRVDELVAEIATASKEQSEGLNQVNTAVTEMDKVTQSNAAGAEETASTVEELSAQAEIMKNSVSELTQLVGGGGRVGAARAAVSRARVQQGGKAKAGVPGVTLVSANGNGNGHPRGAKQLAAAGNRRGEIPMDGDFKDF